MSFKTVKVGFIGRPVINEKGEIGVTFSFLAPP